MFSPGNGNPDPMAHVHTEVILRAFNVALFVSEDNHVIVSFICPDGTQYSFKFDRFQYAIFASSIQSALASEGRGDA